MSQPMPQSPPDDAAGHAERMGEASTAAFGFEDVPRAEKAGRVRDVFARVAGRYDLMNDAMSGGLHRLWKDAMADWLNPQPGETHSRCGRRHGRHRAPPQEARADARSSGAAASPRAKSVIDINAEMLEAGRARGEDGLEWDDGDAEDLPVADRLADAYIIGFGIRNLTDIAAVLREARRILKPGGRFCVPRILPPRHRRA